MALVLGGDFVINPWIGYLTVASVEHDDETRTLHVAKPQGSIIFDLMQVPDSVEVPQGIAAGVVIDTGEGVPDLKRGAKVYYVEESARKVGDVLLVHANYIIAYEEL